MRELSKREGKHTETIRLQSAASKMWIVQYINTALILLAINNRLGDNSIVQKLLVASGLDSVLFNGDYDEFNSGWYGQVGVSIAFTCLLNAVLPVVNIAFYC